MVKKERLTDWLIDRILFLNSEDISTKANSHICRCYSTTNNQDIHSEILWLRERDREAAVNDILLLVKKWSGT